MIDFRSGREPKSSSFDYIQIRIASPEEIRGPRDSKERERLELQGQRTWWSWGEVTKPETINYRSFKPERDGLFCERIFGPVKDWECHCGKYKRIRYRGVICDRCGVEVTLSKVRRERMGHIELAVPVAHIWFFKTLPSPMGNLLDMTLRDLERVIYYTNYVVIEPGEQEVQEKELLDEDRFLELRAKAKNEGDAAFKADIGAPAVRALLERLNVDKLADELREAVAGETSQHRKKQQLKRLKIVDAFRNSGQAGEGRNDPRSRQAAAQVALRHAQGQAGAVPPESARQARGLLRPVGDRRGSRAQAAPVRASQCDGGGAVQAVHHPQARGEGDRGDGEAGQEDRGEGEHRGVRDPGRDHPGSPRAPEPRAHAASPRHPGVRAGAGGGQGDPDSSARLRGVQRGLRRRPDGRARAALVREPARVAAADDLVQQRAQALGRASGGRAVAGHGPGVLLPHERASRLRAGGGQGQGRTRELARRARHRGRDQATRLPLARVLLGGRRAGLGVHDRGAGGIPQHLARRAPASGVHESGDAQARSVGARVR